MIVEGFKRWVVKCPVISGSARWILKLNIKLKYRSVYEHLKQRIELLRIVVTENNWNYFKKRKEMYLFTE